MTHVTALDGFVPTPDRQREFRNVLGCFGTGVTVVTCMTDRGPMGITANSFSAVSLEPPLVLWCPAHSSHRFKAFASARHYAIQVLAQGQKDLGLAFAKDGFSFDHCAWEQNEWGVPVLTETLARFECEAHALHEAGDHAIAVGRVLRAHANEGTPLLFTQGTYGSFTPFD
ncbi:flavin reductase family protein [Donghicola mangrovi]|uniref:Flavin reductase family protein n=1 Tax=Donghicola mangrovi TaxID=2729614 RepID=A0A850Q4Z0_9RHOB|nr:flavin reductase family protein [Donghicola mangrovi]NVO23152.1 flavin reductase family protein [Donghicola mangrovi]